MSASSVSIDLDALRFYYGIHGLGETPTELAQVVLERAVPRFMEILARRKLRATFFVIGEDLRTEVGQRTVAALHAAGHEIANHSFTHPYELARLPEARIDEEIGLCEQAIRAITGRMPAGFRAPGYDTSARVLRVLERRGYRYDSSVFGSWSYYLAKTSVLAALSLVGRRSQAVLIDPRALLAPTQPYRPGASPFRRGQSTVVELPIAVSRALRLPLIGTWLLAAPERVRRQLYAEMMRLPFFNFELHGIDLLDAVDDRLPDALVARQPDLRVPLVEKQRAFEDILDRLAATRRFITCDEAATDVQREGTV